MEVIHFFGLAFLVHTFYHIGILNFGPVHFVHGLSQRSGFRLFPNHIFFPKQWQYKVAENKCRDRTEED